MALVQCPECNTNVSDKADACPKCAHPIKNPGRRDESLKTVGIVVAGSSGFLMFVAMINSDEALMFAWVPVILAGLAMYVIGCLHRR
jgi:hypothetical protein